MKLERGESKDDLESASVQSRTKYLEVGIRPELIKEEVPFGQKRYFEPEYEAKQTELTSLTEAMQSHPHISKFSHDKLDLLRKYMEESHKGRTPKNLRVVSKNFVDKCSN